MNIIPGKVAPPSSSGNSQQPPQGGRERAIAKLTTPSTSPTHESQRPPVNPNSVSVEELGAVRTQSTPQDHTTSEVTPEPSSNSVENKEPPLSSQYAVLARKERALRIKAQQQEAAIANREAQIKAREEAIAAKDAEYSSKYVSKDRLSQDTLNALLDAGITYEQITEKMLNAPNPAEQQNLAFQRQMDAKLKAIEERQAQADKAYQDQQGQQYKQALDQISAEAKQLVLSDPETYEAIKATGSIRDVVQLIERTFKEDGILMTVEEAAKEVEDYLTEEATKLSRLNKIQRRLGVKTPPPATPVKQPQQQQMRTLSNAVGSHGKLSAKERAILAFKGELQK